MKRSFITLAFTLLVAINCLSQTPQPSPQIADDSEVIRVDSSLIQRDFQILDKKDNP